MTRHLSPQQQIALLMEEGSNLGQNPTVRAARVPTSSPLSGSEVIDAVGPTRTTEMSCCTAAGCTYNIQGRHCGLATIEVNDHGGCANYEAAEEDDQDRSMEHDHDVIAGISQLMPADVDHPSLSRNMGGSYNPGAML